MPSSVIAAIDYDATVSRLTITFVSGRIYDYYAVPAAVVDAFRHAESKGAFFNAEIRNRFPSRERNIGAA
ncbi:MAG: hypothetical protein OJF62_000279 [Pseudolabrys sp.]|nr:hypothetical protein [Pseudolabrys sp.]